MPSKSGSLVTLRPPGRAPFRALSIDDLTNLIRIHRKRMAISREDLKKQRLAAMGVVGAEMQASSDMYGRIIDARKHVVTAREAAEMAHMGALSEQIADLNEMAEEMSEFAQAVPSNGGGAGTTPPAKATAAPSAGTAALAALNTAQPKPAGWTEGDAYEGTNKLP
jgi:hypothetical protein